MEFFERVSGARMHTAFYRPFGGDHTALTVVLCRDIARFLNRSARALSGAFLGLLNNRALKSRFASIGAFTRPKLAAYGISGILARSSGWATDLRLQKQACYGAYTNLSFRTFLGRRGDNLDRFLLRIKESVEALRLVSQALRGVFPSASTPLTPHSLSKLKHAWGAITLSPEIVPSKTLLLDSQGPSLALVRPLLAGSLDVTSLAAPAGKGRFSGMEELITHFKSYSEGGMVRLGLEFREVESPKGFVGVFLVSGGTTRPSRTKLRTPVAHNLNTIPVFSVGTFFADFVATFCSLDVVLGEIDR